MDRRIEKTRKALQHAMLELLREKPMEEIDIQALTDKADTARVTFYRHYGTKEDLLLDAIESMYQDLQEAIPRLSVKQLMDFQDVPPEYVLFSFLNKDRELHKKLLTGSQGALIQQRIRHYIVQQIIQTFSTASCYADLPITLIANHMASVAVGNIMWWLSDDLTYSVEYMARMTHWMALTGVTSFIGSRQKFSDPPDTWHMPHK